MREREQEDLSLVREVMGTAVFPSSSNIAVPGAASLGALLGWI